jgi:uncharacterized protein DUF3306
MNHDEKDSDKHFLSRWSQRKRKVTLSDTSIAAEKPAEETEAPSELTAEGAVKEAFDLSSLPKLEDVTETTDITVFLRKGVPESLRNAALRKSWALDPAIRNYVNPALDYAYDWNTPGGVPGNSELAAGTDIAKMVQQIMGSGSAASGSQKSDAPPDADATEVASGDPDIASAQNPRPDLLSQQLRLPVSSTEQMPVSADVVDSEQVQVESSESLKSAELNAPQQEVRRHGTAKPRV